MTKYVESETPPDTRSKILDTFAEGSPYVFIICKIDADGSLDLKLETGGGIYDARTIRSLLEKTIAGLPE